LADRRTINAFALPGGQVFITEALYRGLSGDGQTAHDGRLAGVLGHEIGHVLERHGSERLAKGSLLSGIVGAAGVAGGDINSSRMASYVANLVNMKYGRADELESDRWGIELMILAGYNPEHMTEVMDVLEASSGGGAPPEFMSTHPRPANRKAYIAAIIAEKFPDGVPTGLQ
jgi:predicted Zn-dependent protease